MSSSPPTYIYKLIPSSSPIPSPLPERLPVSELDASSGFIHLSTAAQVLGTLRHFFGEERKVGVLRIEYAGVGGGMVRWEDPRAEVCGPSRGGEGFFPHLYNGLKLGKDEVESVRVLEREEEGEGWDEVVKRVVSEGWLVY